jgi:VanZ family protein
VKPKIFAFVPAVLWLILIIFLLTIPGSDIPKSSFLDAVYFDKWVHIGLFGILTFLWSYPFMKVGSTSKRIFLVITLSAILFGVLMEYVQKFFAYERSFDVFDIFADSIGAFITFGWLIYRITKENNYTKNKPL